jgi:D-alanyl-D-alanine carboxypeptidase
MLLAREILNASSLGHMRRTVVISFEENRVRPRTTQDGDPSHSTFWGHDGTVWGAGALTMTRADGKRQMSFAVNFIRWNNLDSSGRPQQHPIDDTLPALYRLAICGSENVPEESGRRSPKLSKC